MYYVKRKGYMCKLAFVGMTTTFFSRCDKEVTKNQTRSFYSRVLQSETEIGKTYVVRGVSKDIQGPKSHEVEEHSAGGLPYPQQYFKCLTE